MEANTQYINHDKFFAAIRGSGKLFPTMSQTQVDRINLYLNEAESMKLDKRQFAYILATVYHETGKAVNGVMQRFIPVEETGKGSGRPYSKRIMYNGKPYTDTQNIYYGRGDVQLTWYDLYKKAEQVLGIKGLWANPSLALDSVVAMKIAIHGMVLGIFTGAKLSRFVKKDGTFDSYNARTIINSHDKAELIVTYANTFYAAMN